MSFALNLCVQYGFYGDRGASYIGLVVVKAGASVVAIGTRSDASGATLLPPVFVNGVEVVLSDGARVDVSGNQQATMQVSVLAANSSTFSFEFASGASMSVEVMYGSVMQRQVRGVGGCACCENVDV